MQSQKSKDELIRLVREFEDRFIKHDHPNPRRALDIEQALYYILSPLFKNDGYNLDVVMSERDGGVDFIALKNGLEEKIGIEVKASKRAVSIDAVQRLIGNSFTHDFTKAVLISTSGFTAQCFTDIKTREPVNIELLDLNGIKNWVSKIEVEEDLKKLEYEDIIKLISKTFIEKIIDDPDFLEKMEWRELERTVAELFEGMAFKVTLTPSSKDGGKDVILECVKDGSDVSYIVEVKHWRSLQRVGQDTVKDFLNVVCREKRQSGLFLATYGFTDNAFEGLTEIERKKLRFGEKDKIVSLCKSYLKVKSGIWTAVEDLQELLFEGTT